MISKAVPPTTQTSPEQTSKNFKVRMLSPQTPKQKIESMLEKMELNTKNFPSKTQVCKGESSDKIHFFSPQHSNSPIVNYYAGINHPSSNPGSVMAYYSPDLILDEHGNYVIQKVLSCADVKTQNEMLQNIPPIMNKLKNVNFGERIISRLMVSFHKCLLCLVGKKGKSIQIIRSIKRRTIMRI